MDIIQSYNLSAISKSNNKFMLDTKILHLTIIIIAFSMLILNWAQVEGKIVPQTIMQLYKESDIILVGNVTSVEITSSGIHTFYHIKVEQFLKSPQQSDTITVVGSGPNGGHPPPDPKFMVGDRVRLYLYEEDGMHMISMYSTTANPKCYAHELLGLGPREPIPRGGHDPKYSEINCGPPYANPYPNTVSFLPPTIQFKSGIPAEDVECKQDLQLIFKAKDGHPACVKPETKIKLIERGWARSDSPLIDLGLNDSDIVQEQTIILNKGIDDLDSGTSFNPIYAKSILGVDNKITWFNAKQESVHLQSDENYFNVTIAPREKFSFTYDTVGIHKYHDPIHWKRGTVLVSTNEIESSNLRPAKLLGKNDDEIAKTIVDAALSDDKITKKRLDNTMLSAYVTQRGGDVIVPKSLGILCSLSECDAINYRFGMTKPLYYPKNADDGLNFTKNFMNDIGYKMDGTEWIDAVDFGSYITVTIQQKVQGWIIPNQAVSFTFFKDNTSFSFGRWYDDITSYQFKLSQDDAKTIAKEFMQKEVKTNQELKKFQYKIEEIGQAQVIIFDDKPVYVIPIGFKSTLEQEFENGHCGGPEYFTQLVMIEGITGAVLGLDLPGCA